MRVVRNAKRVSVIGGGVVVVAAGFGLWRAAMLLSEHESGRRPYGGPAYGGGFGRSIMFTTYS